MRISDWSSDVCSSDLINRLNAYILPGRAAHPAPGLEQAQAGEALGLGGIFLSERWETKELGAMMGALTQATSRVKLVAGLTHFGTRHPLVQAGMGATLPMLSGNRFVLGFGDRKSVGWGRGVSVRGDLGGGRVLK